MACFFYLYKGLFNYTVCLGLNIYPYKGEFLEFPNPEVDNFDITTRQNCSVYSDRVLTNVKTLPWDIIYIDEYSSIKINLNISIKSNNSCSLF